MITVACVLRSGGYYSPDWVAKLHNACARNLPPHRFICLTDEGVPGVECHTLQMQLPGWWSKLELFRFAFSGPVLYLDLDCVVIDSLEWIADELRTLQDGELRPAQDFISDGINSSALLFKGDLSHLWTDFMIEPAQHMHTFDQLRPGGLIGDQGFIQTALAERGQEARRLPAGRIVSYKRACRAAPPCGASVVAFHGRPKPDQLTPAPDWVKVHWQ